MTARCYQLEKGSWREISATELPAQVLDRKPCSSKKVTDTDHRAGYNRLAALYHHRLEAGYQVYMQVENGIAEVWEFVPPQ